MPNDDVTISWVFRANGRNRAVLSAISEDGSPIDDLRWDMTR